MRFLILTQYFPPEIGAPQVRLSSMARELRRAGHEVEIVTGMPNHPTGRISDEYRGRFYTKDSWDGFTVHRVWLFASLGTGPKRVLNYLSFMVTSLFGLLKAKRPDILFIESPPLFLGISGLFAAQIWRSQTIFNVADLWPDAVYEIGAMKDGILLDLAKWLESFTYKCVTYVNAVTDGVREILIQKKLVPAEKVLFLPNGVDTSLFVPRTTSSHATHDLGADEKHLIVYAGTIGLAHGLEVVVEAMGLLRVEAPQAHLLVIGDGSERERIMSLASRMRLENVTFLRPRPLEFVAEVYQQAKIGIVTIKDLPLFKATRSSKIFPIMASGLPVVHSGSGEGAQIIEGAHAGIVTKAGDPVTLAEAIKSLLNSPEAAAKMGQNGRAYVESYLSWEKIVSDWLSQIKIQMKPGKE